jgi:hypothetical protein
MTPSASPVITSLPCWLRQTHEDFNCVYGPLPGHHVADLHPPSLTIQRDLNSMHVAVPCA